MQIINFIAKYTKKIYNINIKRKGQKDMSKFSGTCDLKDVIDICGGFEAFNGIKIYIGDIKHPLKYNTLKDLIPYYPYSIESSGINKTDKENSRIILSEKSWIDMEEELYGYKPYYDEYRNLLKNEMRSE